VIFCPNFWIKRVVKLEVKKIKRTIIWNGFSKKESFNIESWYLTKSMQREAHLHRRTNLNDRIKHKYDYTNMESGLDEHLAARGLRIKLLTVPDLCQRRRHGREPSKPHAWRPKTETWTPTGIQRTTMCSAPHFSWQVSIFSISHSAPEFLAWQLFSCFLQASPRVHSYQFNSDTSRNNRYTPFHQLNRNENAYSVPAIPVLLACSGRDINSRCAGTGLRLS
jgi:hypothetical protein